MVAGVGDVVVEAVVALGALHPKLAPQPAGWSAAGPTASISSIRFWPTSAIHSSAVAGSNAIRHGLRSPHAHTSGSAGDVTHAAGRTGCRRGSSRAASPDGARSIRSSLPSRLVVDAAPFGVAAGPAVTHRDVQHAVGAKCQVAAVVVRVRLVDLQEHALGVSTIERPVGGDQVLGDDRVAAVVGVVEPGQRRRPKRDAEQAALAAARPVGEVGDLGDLRVAAGIEGDAKHGAVLADDVERGSPARTASSTG